MRYLISNISSAVVIISILGIFISLAWLIIRKIKKKSLKPIAIAVGCCFINTFVFSIIGSTAWSGTADGQESLEQARLEREEKERQEVLKKEREEQQKRIEEEETELERQEKEEKRELAEQNTKEEINKSEDDLKAESTKDKEPKESEKPKEMKETIFYGEIGLNEDYYKGKEVEFSFKCRYVYDDEVEELTTESNLCYGSVKVQFKEKQKLTEGEYITVSGVIGEENSATALMDAEIISRGKDAESNYNNELETFKQSFMSAETVSYEDLLRYPDTYKNQKVKIELDIADVETDGMIFNGTIKSVIPGTENEVALYDYRVNREPRIQEGDKLIVYGVGNKTVTVKVKNGKGLFTKTIDEYDIPCLYVQFVEFK